MTNRSGRPGGDGSRAPSDDDSEEDKDGNNRDDDKASSSSELQRPVPKRTVTN